MSKVAFLDISAFIWNEQHFRECSALYYPFTVSIQRLFEKINLYHIPIWMRTELLTEIQINFPYSITDRLFRDFQSNTLDFLANVKIEKYSSQLAAELTSSPEQVKNYYSAAAQQELRYLLNELFTLNDRNQKFLSFELLYQGNGTLVLSNGSNLNLIALLCDSEGQLERHISQFRNIFDHNPKHNKYKSSKYKYFGEKISALSCYNERIGDKTAAQKLLDGAVRLRNDLYANDTEHDTYVKFVITGNNNLYHGFDVELNEHDKKYLKTIFNK